MTKLFAVVALALTLGSTLGAVAANAQSYTAQVPQRTTAQNGQS